MYIIGLNFGENTYYVRIRKNGWDEVYNPKFATAFDKKKDAVDWGKNETTFGEYVVGLKQEDEIKKYEEWHKSGSVRRSFNPIDKILSRSYKNESALEILNWWVSVRAVDIDTEVLYHHYVSWPRLHSVFSNISEVESTLDGKLIFRMYVKKDATFDKFKEELNLILPHQTYMDGNYKSMSIMDRYLSEHGNSVMFNYKNDDDCSVKGRWSDSHKGNLKSCFEYLKEDRYYE